MGIGINGRLQAGCYKYADKTRKDIADMLASGFYNMDCMDALSDFPDQFFDLAIVDPPYGDIDLMSTGKLRKRMAHNFDKKNKEWYFKKPSPQYFSQLFRVSKNQIIWGGNHFLLPPTREFVVWDKMQPQGSSFGMCEYAWTSFNGVPCIFQYAASKGGAKRIHPTQKPIELYIYLLMRYAKKGDKILDTHVGSASSLIACYRNEMTAWGFEIDKTMYQKAKLRLDEEMSQLTIMDYVENER